MNKKGQLLILTLLSGFSVFAQLTGGGSGQNNTQREANPNQWISYTFGLSNPMGQFKENNLTKPFNQAVGAKPGFYFDFDGNFYSRNSSENPFKLGFSFVTGFAMQSVNWEKWVSGTTSFSGTPFILGHVKIGMIGTFKITEDVKVDGFVRLGINYGAGGGGKWTASGSSTTFRSDNFTAGFGTNFGANIRYKKLIGTLQINTGNLKLEYSLNAGAKTAYSVPITTFRLGIGVEIGKRPMKK